MRFLIKHRYKQNETINILILFEPNNDTRRRSIDLVSIGLYRN